MLDADPRLEKKFLRLVADLRRLSKQVRKRLVLANKLFGRPFPVKNVKKSTNTPLPKPKAPVCILPADGSSQRVLQACVVDGPLIIGTWDLGGEKIKISPSSGEFKFVGVAQTKFGTAGQCEQGNPKDGQWWMNPTDDPEVYRGEILTWTAQCVPEPKSSASWRVEGDTLKMFWGARVFVLTRA